MAKARFQREAFGRVDDQQAPHHAFGLLGDLLPRGRVHVEGRPPDLLLERHRLLAVERVPAAEHDEEHRAEAPEVTGLRVAPVSTLHGQDLGRPILRRAHEGLGKRGLLADDFGQAEICDLDLVQVPQDRRIRRMRGGDENVLRLQISVYDVPRVHVAHALEELPEDVLGLHLVQALILDDAVKKLTAPDELHDQEHRAVRPVHVVQPHYPRVSQIAEDLDLAIEFGHLGIEISHQSQPLKVDDLNGQLLAGPKPPAHIDSRSSAATQLLAQLYNVILRAEARSGSDHLIGAHGPGATVTVSHGAQEDQGL
mmetsp:Transcript_28670/g.82363  ORF Transcript_28670/g.82363 Transcript_28670/m.82363 type:complete len:311 (+) Transcript_28670:2032-2964(+)